MRSHVSPLVLVVALSLLGCGDGSDEANGEKAGATLTFEGVMGAQVSEGSHSWSSVHAAGATDLDGQVLTTVLVGAGSDPCDLEFTVSIDGYPTDELTEFSLSSLSTSVNVTDGGAAGLECETETPKRWASDSGVLEARRNAGYIEVEFSMVPMSSHTAPSDDSNDAVGTFVVSGSVRARDFR